MVGKGFKGDLSEESLQQENDSSATIKPEEGGIIGGSAPSLHQNPPPASYLDKKTETSASGPERQKKDPKPTLVLAERRKTARCYKWEQKTAFPLEKGEETSLGQLARILQRKK